MKRTYLVALIIMISAAATVKAQMRLPNANITSGNPVSSLFSSGGGDNIGVDMYTGKLNVGVKIFHYSNPSTKLDHAISLRYNGGGVKVDDLPSDIGTNWTIDIGGYLFREIKGLPDDDENGWMLEQYPEPTFATPSPTDSVKLERYISNQHDGEFDIYSFAAGGNSGRFINPRDHAGILQIPKSNLIITPYNNWNGYSGAPLDSSFSDVFEMKNEAGVRYIFGMMNCLKINLYNEQIRNAPTQWLLTKIIAPNNDDSIVFNYRPIIQEFYAHNQINYTALGNLAPGVPLEYCGSDYPVYALQRSRELILSSVVYTNGTTVTFDSGYHRYDLHTNKVVDGIRISNGGTSYGYKMGYEYTSSSIYYPNKPYADYSSTGYPEEIYYRLTLKNIKRYSGNDTLPYYKFTYNPNKVPERGALGGVDIFGYSHPASLNSNGRIQQYDFQGITYPGGQCIPDQATDAPMSLETIYLPTGGKMDVSYEPNDTRSSIVGNDMGINSINQVGGIRVKSTVQSDGTNQSNSIKHEYAYVEDDGQTSSGVLANFPMFGYKYTETFDPVASYYTYQTYHKIQDCSWPNSGIIGSTYDFLIRSKNPMNTLIKTHGANVGYGRVVEYLGTSTAFAKKIVHHFTTPETYPIPSNYLQNTFPFPYIPDLDFVWGIPTREEEYSSTNQLLKTSSRLYNVITDDVNDPNYTGLKVGLKKFPAHNSTCYTIKSYHPLTGKVFITDKYDTVYYAGGKHMETHFAFEYDTSKNILSHIYTTNAKGENIRTDLYYSYQFSNTGAVGLLNSAKRIYQPLRVETWKTDGTPSLMAVTATQLNTFSGIPRISNTFDFTPAQPITTSLWGTFNANQVLQAPQYFTAITTVDKYDSRGNVQQQTTKGITSTTIYGYNKTHPIAKVANAASDDVAYTSFEGDFFGWQIGGTGSPVCNSAFNGNYGGKAGGGVVFSKSGLTVNKTYILTVWTNGGIPNVSAGGTSVSLIPGDTHNGWTMYRAKFSNATVVSVGGNGTPVCIDELRLMPEGAVMSTATYHPLFGISSACDASGHAVYYEYDGFGRVKYQRDLDGNILRAYDYKSQQPQF